MYERRVLDALAPAVGSSPTELTVLRTVRRNRSALYFVGLVGEQAPRWVVKRPDTERRQQDLSSPSDATAQFEALTRLHRHLTTADDHVGAPRPVALLPQVESLAMEHVAGPTLAAMLRPAGVLRPEPLLDGVAAAARALRELHQLAPGVDAQGEREVLLHGDWAPENVVVSGRRTVCLDPELARRGPPERDVARFVVMLFDAPFFVVSTGVPTTRRFRHRALLAFLQACYADAAIPPLLQVLVIEGLAARWAMRDRDVVRRSPPGRRSRRLLLSRHFSGLLAEVGAPGWPGIVVPSRAHRMARVSP